MDILLILVLVYIGFGAYLFLFERSIIYYPDYPSKSDFYNCPAFKDSETIDIEGTRGYFKHVSDNIAVVYHGNAGSACDRDYLKSIFINARYSYLFVEYSGYGGDGKKPSRDLLLKDAENIVSFLKTKRYSKTVIITESIGAGVASYHAFLMPPDKMLFISPFDSIVNVAKNKFPIYPFSLLERFATENYDNIPLLKNYKGELTIVHGTNDDIIPFKRGKALYENVPTQSKNFIPVSGAGHNDIYNFEETQKAISDFLK